MVNTQNLTPEDIKKLASQSIQAQKTLSPAAMQKLAAVQQAKQQQDVAKTLQKKITDLAKKTGNFKDAILKKYKDELIGISVLPPRPAPTADGSQPKMEDMQPELLLLLDIDKEDLRELLKRKKEVIDTAEKLRGSKLKGVNINCLVLKEVWDACMKGKYEILNIITAGMPVYDKGWLGAVRAVEMHKSQVLQKFEKYVVCYVLAGSMVRGDADETSDIDTYIVIDDTDVTRMTSQELRTKLMSIIVGMAGEATMRAGVKNPINVQVYVLSSMWESIRDAHPVIFTLLRDGIPLYDRGMFTPWKQLLQKGKIKPTPESVQNYVKSGKQMITSVKRKLRDIAIEDLFWAASIPAQGALMLAGQDIPDNKSTPGDFEEYFVKKRKLMDAETTKILAANLKLRKDAEHGTVKEVSAKMVAKNLEMSEKFLEAIEKLFDKLEKDTSKSEIKSLWARATDDIEAALKLVGCEKTTAHMVDFKKYVVDKKLASKRYYALLERIEKLAKKCDVSRVTIEQLSFEQERLAKDVYEKIRADKGCEVSRFRVSVKYGKKTAAVWLFGDNAYVVKDINDPKTAISKYSVTKKSELVKPQVSDLDAIDKDMRKFAGKPRELSDELMASFKKILGKSARVIIGA